MSLLERAIEIAVTAHKEQVDKAGKPYILHPLRLMFKMQTENEMIAAVLHDVVEDTDWTIEKLEAEGFSAEVITCLLYTSPSPRDRTRYRMPSSA